MSIAAAAPGTGGVSELLDFDAVVIGAGVAGLYQGQVSRRRTRIGTSPNSDRNVAV